MSSFAKKSKTVGMANPASLFCLKHRGKLEIRDSAEGQYGICVFPDGSECEEWAYMQGKCKEIQELENRYYLRKAILENRRKRESKLNPYDSSGFVRSPKRRIFRN